MAMADNRQRIMPLPDDRLPGRCQNLAYPEAVLLVNPKDQRLSGEVIVAKISPKHLEIVCLSSVYIFLGGLATFKF